MYQPESLSSREPDSLALLSVERERIAEALALHFAADHIDMGMLEERLSHVYASQSAAQLQSLIADLPALTNDTLGLGSVAMLAPSSLVPPRGVVMAVLGGAARKGDWLLPRNLKVFVMLGGAEIDLRDAKFAPGVTEIDVTAIMGGVEIIVPRGVRVEILGAAVMGGFEASAGDTSALEPGQPVLRVQGLAMMGGVDVKMKGAGKGMLKRFESALKAARRLSR